MAETKKRKVPENRKVVSASTGEDITASDKKSKAALPAATTPEDQKKAKGLRITAVLLWIVGIALEVLAFFLLIDYFHLPNTIYFAIAALVVDLIAVVIGSLLWKRANRLDPASKKNPVKFWLWNNMGLFASLIAFLPFIIVVLMNKELDVKSKRLAAIVAVVALLISGATGIDWNPVSAEDKIASQLSADGLGNGEVYWSRFGKKYHFYSDCSSLSRSEELTRGTVNEAFAAGRDSLCKICEKRCQDEGHLVTGDDVANDNLPDDIPDELPDELPEEAA